jgi:hypothetical protein
MMLAADRILTEAQQAVDVEDTDTFVGANLERLVDAIEAEAGLSPAGREITARGLLADTVNRLEGLKWLGRFPEIADEPIAAPVFVMGLPRSGTTYFQYLFDRDPRFRLIRSWEALAPSPPPCFDPASAQQRMESWAERRRAARPQIEGFDALHLVDQDGSEECHAFLEQSFGAAGLNNLFRVPSYFDYLLDGADLEASYRVHKRQLQLLQWRSPARPWALKYPNHVLAVDQIVKVYPGARFVMTHRDPVQTLASIAKMSWKLRSARCEQPIDPRQVGTDMVHFIARHIDRILAAADGPHGQRIIHVDYYALLDDPAAVMLAVHEGLGIDSPAEVRQAVADWRRANPKNARGANDYSAAQFGLDEQAVVERFGPYMRRFAIPREREGLSQPRSTS